MKYSEYLVKNYVGKNGKFSIQAEGNVTMIYGKDRKDAKIKEVHDDFVIISIEGSISSIIVISIILLTISDFT